mmetsp:Transcript_2366/g.10082  ORF Transcript_2366/g.10082 Transcript_2366/m.10082 type:complete len:532 (-) Transcript_2366:258-1853(-)
MGLSDIFIDVEGLPEGPYGFCQLLFLLLAYGYILFQASNMISNGSELLLLVPSLAGLVGSCVLPVLGAVPDGAIVLFSGMGPDAQEQLAVGVGALAGSTTMLLTIPWFLSVYAGRVDIDSDGDCVYKVPKIDGMKSTLFEMGVQPHEDVRVGAQIMMITSLSYLLIQVPASYLHGPTDEVAAGEQKWALAAMVVCVLAFILYLVYQYHVSQTSDEDAGLFLKVDAVVVEKIKKGEISLLAVMSSFVKDGPVSESTPLNRTAHYPRLEKILKPFFVLYDESGDGKIDRRELTLVLRDLGITLNFDEVNDRFDKYDTNSDGHINLQEFVQGMSELMDDPAAREAIAKAGSKETTDEEEPEEMPEDFMHLPPEEQQRRVLMRSFYMMGLGTALVLLFSDPMVDVLSEFGKRINVPPFYVSFILAPLASNASELIASYNYALKKTRNSITISLTALEGAGSMNNTFCLGVFMVLIYAKRLAWQYTAETISILFVQFAVGLLALIPVQRVYLACFVLLVYPIALGLVAGLEAAGFD